MKNRGHVPTSQSELIAQFIHVWHRDEELPEMCKRLVESMPDRVAAVVAAKGAQTRF